MDGTKMPKAEHLLKVVDASPERVAAHDKRGWLALFTEDATVEDPVGSMPNRRGQGSRHGDDELSRFYDTFIEPNRISFEIIEDFVASWEVARDVIIHTILPTGLSIMVPAHLIYRLREVEGELKIHQLLAHWELPRMSKQALSEGLKGLRTMAALSWHMVRIQGIGGVLGYSRGMSRGIFETGRETVNAFVNAVNNRDVSRLSSLFAGSLERVEYPIGCRKTIEAFLDALPPDSTVRADPSIAAGWTTSFRFTFEGGDGDTHPRGGLAFVSFGPGTKLIERARFFLSGSVV
jgi:hypothetical protein